MDRALIALMAAALAACGGAPPPTAEAAPPPRAEPPAPPPPRVRTVVLSAAMPAARTASGLAPDGTLYCRQTYYATPPSDEAGCIADGHGITAPLLQAIDPSGGARIYLDGALAIVRIGDCGNGERPVRRPPAALVRRLAPALATAPASSTIELRTVQFASCALTDVALRFAEGATLTARGAVLRLHAAAPSEVALVVAGEARRAWDLGEGDLELEALCNERFAVVTAGVVDPDEPERATTRETTMPCTPEATPRAWRSFERLRVDRETGEITPVVFTPPALSTALR